MLSNVNQLKLCVCFLMVRSQLSTIGQTGKIYTRLAFANYKREFLIKLMIQIIRMLLVDWSALCESIKQTLS